MHEFVHHTLMNDALSSHKPGPLLWMRPQPCSVEGDKHPICTCSVIAPYNGLHEGLGTVRIALLNMDATKWDSLFIKGRLWARFHLHLDIGYGYLQDRMHDDKMSNTKKGNT